MPCLRRAVRIAHTLCRYRGTALLEIEKPGVAIAVRQSSPPDPMTRRAKTALAAVIVVVLGGWIAALFTSDSGGRGTSSISRGSPRSARDTGGLPE